MCIRLQPQLLLNNEWKVTIIINIISIRKLSLFSTQMVDVRSAHWQQPSKYVSCFLLNCGALTGDSFTDRPENCSNCHQHKTLIRSDVTDHPAVSENKKSKRKCTIALGLELAMREHCSLLTAWNCVISDYCSKNGEHRRRRRRWNERQ